MTSITSYGLTIQNMTEKSNTNPVGSVRLDELNNNVVQAQLRAAGIDINSQQYKAVLGAMKNGSGSMYANIQGIKNLMKQYDEEGELIRQTTKLSEIEKSKENLKSPVTIPESSKEEIFEQIKKEFSEEDDRNSDTVKRSELNSDMVQKMPKDERKRAGYTLEQYEKAYRKAFVDAIKDADPSWEMGEPVKIDVWNRITRTVVEEKMKVDGNTFVFQSLDMKI